MIKRHALRSLPSNPDRKAHERLSFFSPRVQSVEGAGDTKESKKDRKQDVGRRGSAVGAPGLCGLRRARGGRRSANSRVLRLRAPRALAKMAPVPGQERGHCDSHGEYNTVTQIPDLDPRMDTGFVGVVQPRPFHFFFAHTPTIVSTIVQIGRLKFLWVNNP